MPAINKSPAYRKFIDARDRALERIHMHALLKINHSTAKYLSQVLFIAKSFYHRQNSMPVGVRQLSQMFEHNIKSAGDHFLKEIIPTYIGMQRAAYLLANLGEAEAIGRALGKQTKFDTRQFSLDAETHARLYDRLHTYVAKLQRELVTSFERAMLSMADGSSTEKTFIYRLQRSFPKTIKIPKKAVLKKPVVKEAEYKVKDLQASFGYYNEQEWDQLVDAYLQDYIPEGRDPETSVELGKDEVYGWELERDTNHAFVQSVREGQVDAAKENGIDDFLWIAILDGSTDYCCEWRDGLTTSEIEAQLESKHSDDECDATVPPAHFNCRCTLAPVTDDLPDKPDSSEMEFEDWLSSS